MSLKPLLKTINAENNVYISVSEAVGSENSPSASQGIVPDPSSGNTNSKNLLGPDDKRGQSGRSKNSSKNARTAKSTGKRQAEFNKIFSSDLPEEEKLIADFSCALVRDILVQGRLYLTENYCCFHSTILRWETSAIIPYLDITQISKERTVKIIPNAISVHCNQNKYIFTSFTARDRALYIFKELWKAKLQLAKGTNTTSGQNQTTDQKGAAMVQNLERTESEVQDPEFDIDDSNNVERVSNASQNSDENETDLPPLYAEDKGAKIYLDCEFPVPVDTLFSLLWLPSSPFWSAYMTHRKTKNWTCEEWRTESDGKIMRECKCLQHIQLPMGAKDIPQVDHHQLVLSENSRRIVLDARTYIREIPYGDSFHTYNRWQFLRSNRPNTSRLRVATLVCYEKQCWQIVKGFIEKNAYEGNSSFMIELREELTKFIQTGSVCPTGPVEGGGGGLAAGIESRRRSASEISVRRLDVPVGSSGSEHDGVANEHSHHNMTSSSSHQDQPTTVSSLGHATTAGIDHIGALKHWMIWLFFFFIGVILFSNWSLHSRLSQIEGNIGGQTLENPSHPNHMNSFVTQQSDQTTTKSLGEISDLLKVLVQEVKNLRNNEAATPPCVQDPRDEL